MDIGKEQERITVEPIEDPVPAFEPAPEREADPEPEKVPVPKREREKVPA